MTTPSPPAHGFTRPDGIPSDPVPDVQTRGDMYLDNLNEDQKRIYSCATSDIDLSPEIRLMRTVLAVLEEDVPRYRASIAQVLTALVRAVAVQARTQSEPSGIEQQISRWTEDALRRLHGTPHEEPAK